MLCFSCFVRSIIQFVEVCVRVPLRILFAFIIPIVSVVWHCDHLSSSEGALAGDPGSNSAGWYSCRPMKSYQIRDTVSRLLFASSQPMSLSLIFGYWISTGSSTSLDLLADKRAIAD